MSLVRPSLLAVGMTLAMMPSASNAQQPNPAANFREKFIQLDANSDTILERDEIPEAGRDAFDRLLRRGDTNTNGKLEADEMRALGQKIQGLGGANGAAGVNAGARLKAMDKDGDGKVTRSEFTGPAPLFDRLDADKNGEVTQQEARQGMAAAARPADTAKAKASAEADGPLAARLKAMDKNGDGKVSRDEFPRPNAFDRLDANKDGFLSADEMPRPGAATPKAKGKAKARAKAKRAE